MKTSENKMKRTFNKKKKIEITKITRKNILKIIVEY